MRSQLGARCVFRLLAASLPLLAAADALAATYSVRQTVGDEEFNGGLIPRSSLDQMPD